VFGSLEGGEGCCCDGGARSALAAVTNIVAELMMMQQRRHVNPPSPDLALTSTRACMGTLGVCVCCPNFDFIDSIRFDSIRFGRTHSILTKQNIRTNTQTTETNARQHGLVVVVIVVHI
jgi:hypothetical protein